MDLLGGDSLATVFAVPTMRFIKSCFPVKMPDKPRLVSVLHWEAA
jgi:hypothetical protein